jgi:Skp family chaperone for outer membrane proteins
MLKLTALTLCTVFGLSTIAVNAMAQSLPSAVIAVIDTQQIRRDSLAGKDFSRQVEVIQAEFQTEYNKISEELKKEEQELQNKRAVMTPEAFEAARREFAGKYQNAQQSLEEKQRNINLAITKANNELSRALLPIFKRITESRGANVLLERGQIVLPAPKLDITPDVITELDKILPSIDVKIAAASAQQTQ